MSMPSYQAASGAFKSRMDDCADENCFVTASAALLLNLKTQKAELEAALDFVEACESPDLPGAFVFYPPHLTAAPISNLPPDADDTALAWLALLRCGRRNTYQAREAFRRVFNMAQCYFVPSTASPWIRKGAVKTWLIPNGSDNPIDLIVNINVAALAKAIGLEDHPIARGAHASLLAATKYNPNSFARRIAPYYADISELWFAIQRATSLGETCMAPALEWAASTLHERAFAQDKPLYCNSHGRPVWRSIALQQLRAQTSKLQSHPPIT